ncbi:class I SAM-dependent methyltransferase [Arsenicicoccus dermatophilus]|uniref:class I SAM-dependent methyltransferase n=1 Tax=Arsenicicoccus dermatophilus TaxID=1076331 RepID=UPI00391744C2
MDARLRTFHDDFYRDCVEPDRVRSDRLARWRNLKPDSAELLAVVTRAAGPRTILELGTSNGYSTCWLADCARDLGTHLTSVDNDPFRPGRDGDVGGCP